MAQIFSGVTPELPQPILDVADIDEALQWTSMSAPRDEHWWRWVDGLLDQRNLLDEHGHA